MRPPAVLRWSLLAAAPVAVGTALVLLSLTGGLGPPLLGDPGVLVRLGLPVVRAVLDLALATLLGLLLLLAAVVPPASRAWARGAALAAVIGTTWAVCAIVLVPLIFSETLGAPLSSPEFLSQLGFFVTEVEAGRLLAVAAVLAVVAATVPAVGLRGPNGAGLALVLTLAAIVPVALTGHGAGSSGHRTAVSAWGLHIVGIGAWVGGLIALALLAPVLGRDLPAVARRFSALAGWAFVLVVVSGVASASTRVSDPLALASPYGLLVVLKAGLALALGYAGHTHRVRTLASLDAAADPSAARGLFWRLVAVEVLLMAATVGTAVALSRTPTPSTTPGPPVLPATGEVAPPMPLEGARWVTESRPDLLWLLVVAAVLAVYLSWVVRLRARGDAWPVGRTVSWVAGCMVLAYVTSVGPAAYTEVLFSAHVGVHMALTAVVAPLLVVGAPVTLALRALSERCDGSRGPREWLLVLVHSRIATSLSRPVVAALLFAGSIVVFYSTDLLSLSLSTHLGHELMQVHLLGTGYLFASTIIGIDFSASRPPFPLRLLLLLGVMAFHALFGSALLWSDSLLQAGWFSSLGLGVDALADQRLSGVIAWGIGQLSTVVLALVMAAQWSRSDAGGPRRGGDRAADPGEATLSGDAVPSRIGGEVRCAGDPGQAADTAGHPPGGGQGPP